MKSLKTFIFGTTLAIGLGFAGSTALADTLYTVKSGDTLSSISTNFIGDNSLINQIAEDNKITDINVITVGQELTIKTDGVATDTENSNTDNNEQENSEDTYQESVQYDTSDSSSTDSNDSYTGDSSSAKEWIAQKESSGSYSATNGQYIGRYQLTDSYLNGDYSEENQERVADQYVSDRYGSWEAAQEFWMNNGWY